MSVRNLKEKIDQTLDQNPVGAEIDLALESGLNQYWAIEIKASRMPKPTKGFHIACKDLKAKKKFVV